jgi:hypothetical protein
MGLVAAAAAVAAATATEVAAAAASAAAVAAVASGGPQVGRGLECAWVGCPCLPLSAEHLRFLFRWMPLRTCGVVPAALVGVGVADYRPVISVPNQSTPQKGEKIRMIYLISLICKVYGWEVRKSILYINRTLITLPYFLTYPPIHYPTT